MTTVLKGAPPFFYYAMVDGTSAVDSIAFGKELDAKGGNTGWRNLLDMLERDPNDPARLVDPDRDYLPIYKAKRDGRDAAFDQDGTACICPGGLNSKGRDLMWLNYNGGKPVTFPGGLQLSGRHAASELSARFINEFMLNPSVSIDGSKTRLSTAGGDHVFRASLLYVSSHGWLGGFSRGDPCDSYDGLAPDVRAGLPQPPQSFLPYAPYFAIGKWDKQQRAFQGPEWIILAQCSTLNVTTWAMWARVMARSSPTVRGILGYEEASPAAVPSISIAKAFFDQLSRGGSFVEAWKAANQGQNWAFLVHKDATKDTLRGWPTRREIKGATMGDYLGAASRAPAPVVITDPPAPFGVEVLNAGPSGEGKQRITPDVLDSDIATIFPDTIYRVVIDAPPDRGISDVEFEWIHIRRTFKQFALDALFSEFGSTSEGVAKTQVMNRTVLKLTLSGEHGQIKLRFKTRDLNGLRASGLEAHHSYLWPRIRINGGTLTQELKGNGLLWYDFSDE